MHTESPSIVSHETLKTSVPVEVLFPMQPQVKSKCPIYVFIIILLFISQMPVVPARNMPGTRTQAFLIRQGSITISCHC